MKNNKITNIIFISLFILFWTIASIFFIKNSNEVNLIDNRKSYKFGKFNINDFKNNKYQDNVEASIRDQMPKYNYFQLLYPKVKNYVSYKSSDIFLMNNKEKYINLDSINYYRGYLLYDSISNKDLDNIYKDNINRINKVEEETDANIYLYYINGDTNINFEKNEIIDVDKYLENNKSTNINYQSLIINSFEDYKKYYYKTDHHLNNEGTEKVYEDLIKFMNLDNKIKINNKVCYTDKIVYGSKSKVLALDNLLKEKICIYLYNTPKYKIIGDNNELADYGNTKETLDSMKTIAYAAIYGTDFGKLLFINEETNTNKKLLLYSNSYSNSLNKLIASHYKETHVIDGRYYENFNMIDYIKENDIDDVLILSNKMLIYDRGDF